jgi:hypothetical protein
VNSNLSSAPYAPSRLRSEHSRSDDYPREYLANDGKAHRCASFRAVRPGVGDAAALDEATLEAEVAALNVWARQDGEGSGGNLGGAENEDGERGERELHVSELESGGRAGAGLARLLRVGGQP